MFILTFVYFHLVRLLLPVGIPRTGDEDLVLLDGVDGATVAAIGGGALDLTNGALQLLDQTG